MKKNMKMIVSLVMAGMLMFTACSSNQTTENPSDGANGETTEVTEPTDQKDKFQIANVEFVSGSTWWNLAYKGMQEQAEYFGDIEVTTVG